MNIPTSEQKYIFWCHEDNIFLQIFGKFVTEVYNKYLDVSLIWTAQKPLSIRHLSRKWSGSCFLENFCNFSGMLHTSFDHGRISFPSLKEIWDETCVLPAFFQRGYGACSPEKIGIFLRPESLWLGFHDWKNMLYLTRKSFYFINLLKHAPS